MTLDETVEQGQAGHLADHDVLHDFHNDSLGQLFNVKVFGAVGDGSTDDTAAIQATVDASQTAPVTSGIAGGDIYFPPGQYQISDKITFDRFVGIIRGAGPGTPPGWLQDSNNSVIEWAGDNASPMFLITDSRDITVEQLRFQGNDTNPPTYAIECKAEAGDNKGANFRLTFRNLVIGEYPFTLGDSGRVDRGIGFTGLNQNNAEFYIEKSTIRADDIGLYLPNSQSVWGSLQDVVFLSCATGIETDARLYLSNVSFQNSGTQDLNITGSANVVISQINSENTAKFATVAKNAILSVYGGQIQCGDVITGGGVLLDLSPSGAQVVIFREVTLTQMTDAANATIDLGPDQGASVVGKFFFKVENGTDWDPAQLNSTDDFWAQVPESQGVIEWSSYTSSGGLFQFRNELRGRANLGAGQRDAVDTTVWDLPHGAAEEGWQVPAFTDAARPNATACVAGTMIWNTDDGFPNWSDGTNWSMLPGLPHSHRCW